MGIFDFFSGETTHQREQKFLAAKRLFNAGDRTASDFVLNTFSDLANKGYEPAIQQLRWMDQSDGALDLLHGGQQAAAFAAFKRLADAGMDLAKSMCGEMLLEGRGVQTDSFEAIRYLQAAVDGGCRHAEASLARARRKAAIGPDSADRRLFLYRERKRIFAEVEAPKLRSRGYSDEEISQRELLYLSER
jgi:hypothetical protein